MQDLHEEDSARTGSACGFWAMKENTLYKDGDYESKLHLKAIRRQTLPVEASLKGNSMAEVTVQIIRHH